MAVAPARAVQIINPQARPLPSLAAFARGHIIVDRFVPHKGHFDPRSLAP
jgi:hypothetical protein